MMILKAIRWNIKRTVNPYNRKYFLLSCTFYIVQLITNTVNMIIVDIKLTVDFKKKVFFSENCHSTKSFTSTTATTLPNMKTNVRCPNECKCYNNHQELPPDNYSTFFDLIQRKRIVLKFISKI